MVRDVDVAGVGGHPRPIRFSSIDDLSRTAGDGQIASYRMRTGDRRDPELSPVDRLGEKNQGGDVHPAGRASINVSITSAENTFARGLQRRLDHALKVGRRTKQSGPESGTEGQPIKGDHTRRAVAADGN